MLPYWHYVLDIWTADISWKPWWELLDLWHIQSYAIAGWGSSYSWLSVNKVICLCLNFHFAYIILVLCTPFWRKQAYNLNDYRCELWSLHWLTKERKKCSFALVPLSFSDGLKHNCPSDFPTINTKTYRPTVSVLTKDLFHVNLAKSKGSPVQKKRWKYWERQAISWIKIDKSLFNSFQTKSQDQTKPIWRFIPEK